jgi:hypothetical protein
VREHATERAALRCDRRERSGLVGPCAQPALRPGREARRAFERRRHWVRRAACRRRAEQRRDPHAKRGGGVGIPGGERLVDRLAPRVRADRGPPRQRSVQPGREVARQRAHRQRHQPVRERRIRRAPAHRDHQRQQRQGASIGVAGARRGQALAAQRAVEQRVAADDHGRVEPVLGRQPRREVLGCGRGPVRAHELQRAIAAGLERVAGRRGAEVAGPHERCIDADRHTRRCRHDGVDHLAPRVG